jgi:hypothetical protein
VALVYRNGRPYRYRSKRRNGRVTSEYGGSGQTALLIAAMETIESDERDWARHQEREERKRLDDLERDLDTLVGRGRSLAHSALTAAGYHQHHRGEWRRRRVNRHRAAGG